MVPHSAKDMDKMGNGSAEVKGNIRGLQFSPDKGANRETPQVSVFKPDYAR